MSLAETSVEASAVSSADDALESGSGGIHDAGFGKFSGCMISLEFGFSTIEVAVNVDFEDDHSLPSTAVDATASKIEFSSCAERGAATGLDASSLSSRRPSLASQIRVSCGEIARSSSARSQRLGFSSGLQWPDRSSCVAVQMLG